MTGVSGLNIVLQQGSSAQQVQHTQQVGTEQGEMFAAQLQSERTARAQEKVQGTEDSDELHLKKDKQGGRKGGQRPGHDKQKKKKEAGDTLASTGNLLDTVA